MCINISLEFLLSADRIRYVIRCEKKYNTVIVDNPYKCHEDKHGKLGIKYIDILNKSEETLKLLGICTKDFISSNGKIYEKSIYKKIKDFSVPIDEELLNKDYQSADIDLHITHLSSSSLWVKRKLNLSNVGDHPNIYNEFKYYYDRNNTINNI